EISATRPDAAYLPNAVDFDRFRGLAPPHNDAPVAIYAGALARWVDYPLLARVAAALPDWRFRIYGEALDRRFEASGLAALDNVDYRGACPHASIPEALAEADVGLIPFLLTPETDCVSPIKLYEYLAAGKPVVSTSIAEARNVPGVFTAGTPEE